MREMKTLKPVTLLQAIAHEFGLREQQVFTLTKHRKYVYPRQMYSLLIFENVTKNCGIIGDHIGQDRTTVFYGMKNMRNLIETKAQLRIAIKANQIYERLKSQINSGTLLLPSDMELSETLTGEGSHGQETR